MSLSFYFHIIFCLFFYSAIYGYGKLMRLHEDWIDIRNLILKNPSQCLDHDECFQEIKEKNKFCFFDIQYQFGKNVITPKLSPPKKWKLEGQVTCQFLLIHWKHSLPRFEGRR